MSLTTTIVATITHPLIGYETEAVVWARYLREAKLLSFQPTDPRSDGAFGLGRGWGAIWPFFLAAGGGPRCVAIATLATARTRISNASLTAGVLALAGWCLFAALAPTVLGIDHRGLLSIVGAGDNTALHKGFGDYPLRTLAPLAASEQLVSALPAGAVNDPRRPENDQALLSAGRAYSEPRTGTSCGTWPRLHPRSLSENDRTDVARSRVAPKCAKVSYNRELPRRSGRSRRSQLWFYCTG